MQSDRKPGSSDRLARRRVLTALAVGSAVEVATLPPARWLKPVVESVVLPAHAQTSPTGTDSSTFTCGGGEITADNTEVNNQAQGHVAIIYDGESDCALLQVVDNGEGGASGDDDEMLLLDADSDGIPEVTDFDLRGPNFGANWGPGPDFDDLPADHYSFDIERVAGPNSGTTFRVEFDVSFSGNSMTVSNVQITPL